MGTVPPPSPLSFEEFQERWKAGARTLEEIDPRLAEWREQNRRARDIGLAVQVLGVIAFIALGALAFAATLIRTYLDHP